MTSRLEGRSAGRLLRWSAAGLLLALATVPLQAAAPAGRPAQERGSLLQATLARLDQLGPGRVRGAARLLSGLPLLPEEEPAAPTLGALDVAERALVLDRLEPVPHESLATHLATCAESAGADGTALGILRVLERYGCGDELELLVRTAAPLLEGSAAIPELDAALRASASAVLRRDPEAYRWLSGLILRERGEAALTLVLATGDAGSALGLAELARTLGWDPELDAAALRQIGRLVEGCLQPPEPEVSDAVRGLLGAVEPTLAREAAIAAGRLEDHEALEALIELLEHPDGSVRDAALWSLRRMTGQTLGAEVGPWNTWLWMEQRWLAYTAPMLVEDLTAADEARAVRALNRMSARRYRRDELATEMAVALRDPRASIRGLACTALARLGSRACLAELVVALDDPDEQVAEAAWSALRTLTGRNLPPDPQVWAVLCLPGGEPSLPRER